MVRILRLIFAQAEWRSIILDLLGREGLGEGRVQESLPGCWRVVCAVVLLCAQDLCSDRHSLGWGQRPGEVSAELSVTPEITLQLAGIFMFIFLFAFVSLPE